MKRNDSLRYALHLALVELDNSQTELMKLVCMGKALDGNEWRSALHQHAKMYARLQKILSEANVQDPPSPIITEDFNACNAGLGNDKTL